MSVINCTLSDARFYAVCGKIAQKPTQSKRCKDKIPCVGMAGIYTRHVLKRHQRACYKCVDWSGVICLFFLCYNRNSKYGCVTFLFTRDYSHMSRKISHIIHEKTKFDPKLLCHTLYSRDMILNLSRKCFSSHVLNRYPQ